MDEQTFMVRFEAMRKPMSTTGGPQGGSGPSSTGKGGRRQLLVTHAELARQCKATVRGYEFDNRMEEMQRRRDLKTAEARQARLKSELRRLRREKPKLRNTLEAEVEAHDHQQHKRFTVEQEIARRGAEEKKLEVEDMLELVEGLPLPASVKKSMEGPILSGAFRIKC